MGAAKLLVLLLAFTAVAAVAAFEAAPSVRLQRALQSDFFDGCHCDGAEVHCNSANEEAACFCEEGTVYCE
jgi:hypothetical protein